MPLVHRDIPERIDYTLSLLFITFLAGCRALSRTVPARGQHRVEYAYEIERVRRRGNKIQEPPTAREFAAGGGKFTMIRLKSRSEDDARVTIIVNRSRMIHIA